MGKGIIQYKIDGSIFQFCKEGFKEARDNYKSKHDIPIYKIEEILADKINVSTETIKAYTKGNNGPSDLEMVKAMAEVLECEFNNLIVVGRGKPKKETSTQIPKVEEITYSQPQVELPAVTCEIDVVNNVYMRLLYLLQMIQTTENFTQIPGYGKPEKIYTEYPRVGRVFNGQESELPLIKYYSKYILDTKAIIDSSFIYLSKEVNNKLLRILQEFLCSFSPNGPSADFGYQGDLTTYRGIEILAKTSIEYEFACYYYCADWGSGAILDAEEAFEHLGRGDEYNAAFMKNDPNVFDKFFYNEMDGDKVYLEPLSYLEWTATQALKKLFINEFPQYYKTNSKQKR